MKKCAKCKEEKPTTKEFFAWRKTENTWNPYCRPCQRLASIKYYHDNKEDQKKKAIARNHRNRKKTAKKVYDYLRQNPCIDCGEGNPVKLEFDHQRDKEIEVGTLLRHGYGWDRIKKEINKCEVRCANCHRMKTAKDFNWEVLKLWQEDQR